MASMKFSNDSDEYKMFGEFYQLCQKYYICEENDNYWQDLINETNALYEKWKGKVELTRELCGAIVKYEERMWKDGCDG